MRANCFSLIPTFKFIMRIAIISSSVRQGRNSHRVSLFFQNYIKENNLADVTLLDLKEYDFPVFEERLRFLKEPSDKIIAFADEVKNADGVLIVTPEYNGGYPASLKNVIDLLYAEWKRKPIAIATVSAGPFGGSQVITSLTFSLWKIGALLVPAMFPVAEVEKNYSENGTATDKATSEKRAKQFLEELVWCMNARKKIDQ